MTAQCLIMKTSIGNTIMPHLQNYQQFEDKATPNTRANLRSFLYELPTIIGEKTKILIAS